MTVVMASLIPIMRSTGVGSDVMKAIAAPIIGGTITSTIHVLIITAVIFYIIEAPGASQGHVAAVGHVGVRTSRPAQHVQSRILHQTIARLFRSAGSPCRPTS